MAPFRGRSALGEDTKPEYLGIPLSRLTFPGAIEFGLFDVAVEREFPNSPALTLISFTPRTLRGGYLERGRDDTRGDEPKQ